MLLPLCLILFGWSLLGGRPLTMHEAVLPQTAREMLANGDWTTPTSGGRPWLERPPLPQWIVATAMWMTGRNDAEWTVRLPSILVATAIVLLTAWISGVFFGSEVGMRSGLLLATSFEFVSYAWLAEQDIYLCLLTTATMAMFVRLEFVVPSNDSTSGFFGGRSWGHAAFFVLLGATNLAKGLLFGMAMVGIPIAAYLIFVRRSHLKQFMWIWGWLLTIAVGVAWPIAAWQRFPDVLDLWRFDHVGRLDGSYTAINEPWWYYGPALASALAPWSLAALGGIAYLIRNRYGWIPADESSSREARGLCACWAFGPLVVFSFAAGKHHHYLLPILPAWAMLATLGFRRFAAWVRARGVQASGKRRTLAIVMAATAIIYMTIYTKALPASDQCVEDTAFLKSIAADTQSAGPIFVNADIGSMDCFRMLFYLRNRGQLIHNLDYLLDERLRANSVCVLTRAADLEKLQALGQVRTLATSERSRRENSPLDRFTLFEVRFRNDLARREMPHRISPMQAMGRK